MTIVVKSLRQESRDRYLTYALSVVSGRALPDVRDGLKPVQRRILFAMLNNLRLKPDGSHKKSAAVIGDVLAKYHPHGDVACYEAMVRMAQDFSFRYPLVDGQGNFGSLDGDGPAAYRYTEVKLMPIAIEVLGEITEDTVEFQDNFDASTKEPVVLPCKIPNLLVNGASGIAVGMATSIPPHNLKDVVKAITAYIDDQEISTAKLSQLIKAPDFPTGCSIMNTRQELTEMYRTGRGAVRMRGDWKIEEEKRGKKYIIITSIPYTVDKSQLVEKIASVIIAKKLPQLVDIRDESTEIVRVVMELASPDIQPDLVMAYLFKNTPMEVNFQVNLTALVPAQGIAMRPELLSLKQMIVHFVDFRTEVVQRRLSYELRNLKDRMHILDGFVIIFDALDEAIQIVRKSTGRADSAEKLQKRFKLSEIQALAIVDLRIYQLSRTNIDEIRTELAAAAKRVAAIEAILKDRKKITAIVKADLEEIATRFGDKRKSALVQDFEEVEINEADYVVQEDVFAIVTKDGWLKRIRQQNAVESTRVREGDSILAAHPLSTIDYVGFFTNHGNFYILKVLDFPSSSGYGNPIQKLLKFKDGEAIISSMPIRAPENKSEVPSSLIFLTEGQDLLLVSSDGVGFALTLEGIFATKRNGKRVIKLRETTTLNAVCHFDNNCAFFTHKGSAITIKKQEVPLRNQPAIGVSLMSVRSDDHIVGAVCYSKAIEIDLILNNGKDKRIKTSEITTGKRGLKGTKIIPRGEIEKIKIL